MFYSSGFHLLDVTAEYLSLFHSFLLVFTMHNYLKLPPNAVVSLFRAAAIRFSKVKQLSCTLDGKCRTRHFVKLLFLNLTLTKVSENRFCLVLAGQISYRTIYYLVELYIRPALYYYKGSFPWYYHIWEVMADRPHGNKSIWGIVSRIANVPFTPPASSPVSYTPTSERQLLKSWMPT